jgi:hypothetical protein
MGGNSNSGGLSANFAPPLPQDRVVEGGLNHFKLYDFPLVSHMSLLY